MIKLITLLASIVSKLRKLILVLLPCLLFITIPQNAFANYGETCASFSVSLSDSYFTNSTAYGFLLNNIDMKTNVPGGCNQPKDKIQFCIRNRGALPCDLVSMSSNEKRKVADISTNPDIGGNKIIGDIYLTASIIGPNLCLSMQTSRGFNPLMCRKIETTDTIIAADTTCKPIGKSCYRTTSKSQSLINFSGLTIQCLRETLDTVFFKGSNCPPQSENLTLNLLTPFSEFQEALKVGIRGALILYVMTFGFKVILGAEKPELKTITMFLMKFILVSYFAVGIGPLFYQSGNFKQENGMTALALPVLVEMTSNFTDMVFKAGGSQGLCRFDPAKYAKGYEYYGLWDSIDCRVGFYFGVQAIYNLSSVIKTLVGTFNNLNYSSNTSSNFSKISNPNVVTALNDAFNFSFFTVLFGFFLSGNIVIVICGIVFGIVFISVLLYFLTAYLVCMVTLYVLAYISPIFIPMALFQRTKGYFDAWLKLVISCTLQPAVIGGFIVLLLTVYDTAIYGNCEYGRYDYKIGDINFSTFEIRLPASNPQQCSDSPGYKLVRHYMGEGWDQRTMIFFVVPIVSDIFNLVTGMVYVGIFTFIFYFVMGSISQFASDMTGGADTAGVTAGPTMIVDAAMKAAKWAGNLAEGKMDKDEMMDTANQATGAKQQPSGGQGQSGSGGGSGGGSATDSISTGGGAGGAADAISTGGGGAKPPVGGAG